MKSPAGLTDVTLKARGYRKPMSRHDAWCNPTPADERHRLSMEAGSRALLGALWQRHKRVMLVARAHGRLVAEVRHG